MTERVFGTQGHVISLRDGGRLPRQVAIAAANFNGYFGGCSRAASRRAGLLHPVRSPAAPPSFPERFALFVDAGLEGGGCHDDALVPALRSEEHTSELPPLMLISYAVF